MSGQERPFRRSRLVSQDARLAEQLQDQEIRAARRSRSPSRRERTSQTSSPRKRTAENSPRRAGQNCLRAANRSAASSPQGMSAKTKDNALPGILVCAVAGLAAALASVFGKIALSDWLALPGTTCQSLGIADLCYNVGGYIIYALRAVSLALLVVSNIVMTTSFTRAMHLTSSLTATVAVTSFNFTFTAIFSMLVFGETLPPVWWLGFFCILLGVALLAAGARTEKGGGERGAKITGGGRAETEMQACDRRRPRRSARADSSSKGRGVQEGRTGQARAKSPKHS